MALIELPPNRDLAKGLGSKFYDTGRPCGRGHTGPRYTSIGRCVACQMAATRGYVAKAADSIRARAREKYAANKDAIRAKTKAWYAQTIEARRAYSYARYRKKKEHIKAVRKSYLDRNKDKDAVWQRQKRQRHKAKIAAYSKAYKERNRDVYASAQKARQQLQAKAMPPWADRDAINLIYAEAARLTELTGVRHSVDHIYPLKGKTSCGLHVPWNLQILTLRENIQKSNKAPEEWSKRDTQ